MTKKHRTFRILVTIMQVIYLIFYRISLFVYRKKPPNIPPIKDPLLTLSATTLARKIRQGEITSYDVVDAYVKRIKEANPHINAVVDDRFAAAKAEAKICDEQLKAGKFDVGILERKKPLFGVPITVKESIAVKGLSHTGCTLARKGTKADADATVVELLRDAGAIPLCATNTPEMCCNFDSTNLLYGRTCNPYDSRFTSGGSSGGESALLGAGASLLGIGSDLGGSVRLPALFTGVFGHKPTAGIVSLNGHYPLNNDKTLREFLSIGPMARYAEDLGLALRTMTSKCDRDLRLDAPVDVKRLTIYYRRDMDDTIGILPLSADMERCVVRATNHFAQLGVHTEPLPMEWPSTLTEIMISKLSCVEDVSSMLFDIKDPEKDPMVELGKVLIGQSHHSFYLVLFYFLVRTRFLFSAPRISYYTREGEVLRRKLLDLLGEKGVFVCPTFRMPAGFPKMMFFDLISSAYTSIFNIFGFPAVHVPMGLNRDGLPIGVQVVAAPYQDRLCLAIAKELEVAFGGWIPPPLIDD